MTEKATKSRHSGMQRSTLVFVVLFLVGAACVTYFTIDYKQNPSRLSKEARSEANIITGDIADKIEAELKQVESQVLKIADRLASGELDRDSFKAACTQELTQSPGLYGLWTAFAPLSTAQPDLFDPYCRRQGQEIVCEETAPYVDYTAADAGPVFGAQRTHWYHVPMERGNAWVEPYFCTEGEALMVTYGVKVQLSDAENNRDAVMGGDLSLDRLRQLLSQFSIGSTGYAFILSEEKRLIAHPNRDFLGKTIDEILADSTAPRLEASALRTIHATLSEGSMQGVGLGLEDPEDTQYVLWHRSIDPNGANWTLATVFYPEEIVQTNTAERRSKAAILLSTFPLVVGLIGCLIPQRFGRTRLLVVTATLSLMFVAGISFLWLWSLHYPSQTNDESFLVRNETMTNAVLAHILPESLDSESTVSLNWESTDRITTGMFVQSAKFLGPHNVAVTGYIWQRFSDGRNLEDIPGVVLPEAEDFSMERVASGDDFVRWYFEANLRQSFDYITYPVDRETIWIRLWPANFDEGVILVPDFAAYENMSLSEKPGLEMDFVLEGWDSVGTHFSYRANSYRANFGTATYAAHNNRPELYFNIDIQRKFIGPFVADLLPMLVVAGLLFAVVLIETRKTTDGLLMCNASNLLGHCARFFFVVIVSHVYVREKLAVPQIVYIEWFYFTMYGLLLLLSLCAVSFARERHIRLATLEDSQLVTWAYWPMTLGVLFLITLRTFV